MPGLLTRTVDSGNAPANSGSGIWSKHRDDSIGFDQLQKFWSELSISKRQELLKLDKQTLLERARKNLYCSRCNGLLLEGFSQIVLDEKLLHQEGAALQLSDRMQTSNSHDEHELDEVKNPSVHPWGGLITTKDGLLTVLDFLICARSLKLLQDIFDSARAREHERELLYPDACGGGVRGWTSQGMISYGRGHGTRETCALHTARLSCGTLVGFWSAMSEGTRLSLLRMKEENFIERLMYRFDSKRFCRDCRKNVIREFKELKELKRMKREPRCTSWFCAADSSFSYEVLEDSVQADWHHSFTETIGMYRYFEWAIGTGEGKADILDFQDVGMNRRAQVNGLDLGGLSACFITLRAWRLDGRCTELRVKAHALKGKQCIHRRLIVRDGFVTITWGDNIRRLFEHAEEAEEEEDDDIIDKDGNELDGDGFRPQKHAKSPELAREFLLDAATVIYKEQVENAFREGTARQNAQSIFVCLALKMLEERLHVACKEIITLEKQIKLLEEEEKEKHDEEKRKEKRRTKEREKKLRRKERLKGKGRDQDKELMESQLLSDSLLLSTNELPGSTQDESASTPASEDITIEPSDDSMLLDPDSPDITGEIPLSEADTFQQQPSAGENSTSICLDDSFTADGAEPRQNFRVEKDCFPDWSDKHRSSLSTENGYQLEIYADSQEIASSRGVSGLHQPSRDKYMNINGKACNMQLNDNFHGSNIRIRDRYDPQSCGCNQQSYYRAKDEYLMLKSRAARRTRMANRTELSAEMPRQIYRVVRHRKATCLSDNCDILKGRHISTTDKEAIHKKQVWEPLDSREKGSKSNFVPNTNPMGTIDLAKELKYKNIESHCQEPPEMLESVDGLCSYEHSDKSDIFDSLSRSPVRDDEHDARKPDTSTQSDNQTVDVKKTESGCYSKIVPNKEVDCHIVINNRVPLMSSYSSDNCSSCLSEGDSSTSSSSAQNAESSSTSDSEDVIQQLDCLDTHIHINRSCNNLLEESLDGNCKTNRGRYCMTTEEPLVNSCKEANLSREKSRKNVQESHGGILMDLQHKHTPNAQNYDMHIPFFPPHTMSYYNQSGASWLASPSNEDLSFPQVNNYAFSSRPLGYSYQPNLQSDLSMHYTPMQLLSAPDFDPSRHSVHQMANSINCSSSKDLCRNTRYIGSQRIYNAAEPIVNQRVCQRSVPTGQLSSKSALRSKCEIKNYARPHDESPSFSLFHYGGPMAVLAASNSSILSSLHESAGGAFASKLPTDTCSKEETKINEYRLFSSRNGTRFSFF